MLVFTSAAEAVIRECHPEAPMLRLDISPRGCGAPAVTLEPGQALASDSLFTIAGRATCVDTALCEHAGAITLDSCNGRFTVSLTNPVTVNGCGLCPASPLQGGRCGIIDGMNL